MKHIRIISPSGIIDPKYIDLAAARLRSWGYQVSEGQYARNTFGRFAGTDAERLQDLSDALSDPSIDFILCSRGGYGLQRIISRLLAFSPSRLSPKVIGFSDITELHQWAAIQGQPSLHGLMCKYLSELSEDSEPIRFWQQAVEGEELQYEIPAHPLNRPGEISGTLIGGNLSVLYGLQATPFSLQSSIFNLQSSILFIEDIAERHYHIDRMMQNLKMSGILSQIKGLVVGQFSDCEDDEKMGCTVFETIRQAVEEYSYPVLFDFPAGHVERNLPLWLGTNTQLKVTSEGGKLINNLRM